MTDGISKLLEPFKEKRYCLLCEETINDLDMHYRRIHMNTYSPLTYIEMYTKLIEPYREPEYCEEHGQNITGRECTECIHERDLEEYDNSL